MDAGAVDAQPGGDTMIFTLDQYITSAYRGSIGRRMLDNAPDEEDYLTAFAEQPDLLHQARAEANRLDALIAARSMGDQNALHEERLRRSTLAMMLTNFERAQGQKADA